MPGYNSNGSIRTQDSATVDNGRSVDTTMRTARTVGWDSIEAGVDEFELQERHFDTVDKMAQPQSDGMTLLDDIAHFVSSGRRDARKFDLLCSKYELSNVNRHVACDEIVRQTLKTVQHVVRQATPRATVA